MIFASDDPLLRLLGGSVFDDVGTVWNSFDDDTRSALSRQVESARIEPFFYWMMHGISPDSVSGRFRDAYQRRSGWALRNEYQSARLYRLLENERIRFAPVKGLDLAFRIYPSPGLRFFCDWDILFHPDDCVHALATLRGDGWVSDCPDDDGRRPAHHHYPCHRKDGLVIEPHWTLPLFEGVAPGVLWEHMASAEPGTYRRHLEPELNLLLLTRHAAEGKYRYQSPVKLLLDAGFLMRRETVDWNRLRRMAKTWNFPYPGDLLAAWPEFFPPERLAQMAPDPTTARAFRRLFAARNLSDGIGEAEWVMTQLRTDSSGWLKKRLSGFRPRIIRGRYQLPCRGAWIRLGIAYCRDIGRKTVRALPWLFRSNRAGRRYLKLVERAEMKHDGN